MAISIGATTYPTLRAAINAAVGGNTIALGAGSYDIKNYGAGTGNFFIPGLARFQSSLAGITGLTLSGQVDSSGAPLATITNLERIYASAKDAGFGIPTNWTIRDLKLDFNFPGPSEYILQTGNKIVSGGVVTGATQAVTGLRLINLTFTGNHTGNSGASGAYSDLAGANGLLVDSVTVDQNFGGQLGYTAGTATTLSSGGSAFLFAQGSTMTVEDSTFFEGGYRNTITFYDSAGFTVARNVFDAEGQRKQRGQVFSNSSGQITQNQFLNGTRLDLRSVNRKTITVSGNRFDGGSTTFGLGVVIDSGQTLYNLRTISATGNSFKDVVPFTSLITQVATGASGGTGVSGTEQLSFGLNEVWNPATGSFQSFQRFLVGGVGNDTLDGTSSPRRTDFITGGLGNDTLTGNGAPDVFAFTTPLGPTNVDTITDFKAAGADTIWLDDSVFTGLAKGTLAAADFGTSAAVGVDVIYSGGSLLFRAGGSANLADYTEFAKLSGTSTITPLASDFVVF